MKKQYQAPYAEATSLQTLDGILNPPSLKNEPADNSPVLAPEDKTQRGEEPTPTNPWDKEW